MLKAIALSIPFLLGAVAPARAEQWVYINSTPEDYSFYLDFDSVRGDDYYRDFWYRSVDGSTNRIATEVHLEVNCVFWESTVLESYSYPGGDRFIPQSPHLTPIQQPSIINDLAAFVCERASGVDGLGDRPTDTEDYPID